MKNITAIAETIMHTLKDKLTEEQQKQLDEWADALIKEHEEEERERAREDALHDIRRDEEDNNPR